MSKDSVASLNPEAFAILQDMKRREEAGEIADPHTREALKAISLAGKVMNAIMSGNQIDPVFFKKLSDITQDRILNINAIPEKKVLKKKKKLKRKLID